MPDRPSAAKFSSRLRENFRENRARWWTGGAAVLVALAVVVWLKRRGISFAVMREWISHHPGWFMPLGFAAVALIALVILWKVPQRQVRDVEGLEAKERFDRVNEARKTLATILGGAAFLVGGFFTWQNIKVAQDAASTSQRALEVSREGQITDRFSKAIEQLGSEKLQIRLGGIYALEGIANESAELHWPIVEVLCTYVRVNAPVKPQKSPQKNQAATTRARLDADIHPAADIQAILTVLGRRDQRNEKEGQDIDLSNTDIRGADLRGANFSRAFLWDANFSRATLYQANLSGADLTEADLEGADLSFTDLSGADLGFSESPLGERQRSRPPAY